MPQAHAPHAGAGSVIPSDRLDHIRSEACCLVPTGGGTRPQGRPHGPRGRAVGHSGIRAGSAASRGYERVNVDESMWSHVIDLASLEK